MPSMLHEGPLDLVREHPEIAVELVRGWPGINLPGQPAVALAPTDEQRRQVTASTAAEVFAD